MSFLFTSESVTEGHPDKLCDRISDAIVDEHIRGDSFSRVACETLASGNMIVIAGEITSAQRVNYEKLAREVLKETGYDDEKIGIDWKTCKIIINIKEQSPDIARGVIREEDIGAGDQGMMFGYACTETSIAGLSEKAYMPLAIYLSHKLVQRLDTVRKNGKSDFLRPDGKSQVTVEYENGTPKAVKTVVISCQHSEEVSPETLREFVIEEVIKKEIPARFIANAKFLINPTGRFVIGGPRGDTGLTGRKIIVDTYGGYARHGGGCFSGKDFTKVDRSGAYAARYIAKNIVASGLAKRCEVNFAYVIGIPEPVQLTVNTFGTSKISEEKIQNRVKEVFPLKPKDIIEKLNLRRPIYKKTSVYGHFGREDEDFSWEKTDMCERLRF